MLLSSQHYGCSITSSSLLSSDTHPPEIHSFSLKQQKHLICLTQLFKFIFKVSLCVWALKLIVRAEQQGFFIVPTGAEVTVAAGQGRTAAPLQCGLLSVLLICWGEIMNGILHHIAWIHGLLQAAGDAFHRCTATWDMEGRVKYYHRTMSNMLWKSSNGEEYG